MIRRSTARKAMVMSLLNRAAPYGTTNWRPAESLLVLRSTINESFPRRSKAADGILGDEAHAGRDSDHNPWVKDGLHGVVTAIDITHDPAGGCDANSIVSSLVASRDRRIKYIIWNRQIINSTVSPWRWRKYNGRNPHTAHFHLSVCSAKSLFDDRSPWVIHGAPDL